MHAGVGCYCKKSEIVFTLMSLFTVLWSVYIPRRQIICTPSQLVFWSACKKSLPMICLSWLLGAIKAWGYSREVVQFNNIWKKISKNEIFELLINTLSQKGHFVFAYNFDIRQPIYVIFSRHIYCGNCCPNDKNLTFGNIFVSFLPGFTVFERIVPGDYSLQVLVLVGIGNQFNTSA